MRLHENTPNYFTLRDTTLRYITSNHITSIHATRIASHDVAIGTGNCTEINRYDFLCVMCLASLFVCVTVFLSLVSLTSPSLLCVRRPRVSRHTYTLSLTVTLSHTLPLSSHFLSLSSYLAFFIPCLVLPCKTDRCCRATQGGTPTELSSCSSAPSLSFFFLSFAQALDQSFHLLPHSIMCSGIVVCVTQCVSVCVHDDMCSVFMCVCASVCFVVCGYVLECLSVCVGLRVGVYASLCLLCF